MHKRLLPALLWSLPLLLFSSPAELLMLASAVLLHEGGHLLAFFAAGEPCPSLSAVAAGLLLDPRRPLSYKKELLIVLSGPLANLAVAIPLLLFCKQGAAATLGVVHLFSALCNLLPFRDSDGGRAVYDLLAMLLTADAAARGARLLSLLSFFLMLFVFLFFLLSEGGGGVVLLLVALLSRALATRG